MRKPPKNDLLKDLLTGGVVQTPGDYEVYPFNLPPEPLAGGTEVGGAPTTDGTHEYVIRPAKPKAKGSAG